MMQLVMNAKEEASAFQANTAAAYKAKLKMIGNEVLDKNNGQILNICILF